MKYFPASNRLVGLTKIKIKITPLGMMRSKPSYIYPEEN